MAPSRPQTPDSPKAPSSPPTSTRNSKKKEFSSHKIVAPEHLPPTLTAEDDPTNDNVAELMHVIDAIKEGLDVWEHHDPLEIKRIAVDHNLNTQDYNLLSVFLAEEVPLENKPPTDRILLILKTLVDQLTKEAGQITLDRMELIDLNGLMGKALRSYVTGKVALRGGVEMSDDFFVIDLWKRDSVQGSPWILSKDRYLFRPIPLMYRTWIFHSYYNAGEVVGNDNGTDAMLKHVFSQKCIDVTDVPTGRHSSALYYAPMALATCLSQSVFVCFACCAVLVAILIVSAQANTPAMYRFTRAITLLPRIVWLVVLFVFLEGEAFHIIGTIFAVLIAFYDFLKGDLPVLTSYRYHASYEVIRSLPNRIFVCRRTGGGMDEYDQPGRRGVPVHECISGIGHWDSDMVLLTDLSGMIVELKPMSIDDWKHMQEVYNRDAPKGRLFKYIAIDAYQAPSAPSLDFDMD